MDPVTGKLTAYITSQAPHAHRTVYALVAGLPEHKIQVISPDIGGGFGNKVPIYPGYVLAVVGSIVTKRPVKWMEDRSSNLMTTGFARDYHMHGEIAATSEGKIVGVKVDVLADHGAFNATAQPTKFPAGFFHIFTGSYDYGAAHCKVTGVYTNKAPGGVAYACSFRITEAVYLIERIVDRLADELGIDPAELRLQEPVAARAVPVHDADRLGVRLRRLPAGAARGDAHRRLRRAAARAGREAGARRVHGHRPVVLHRGRRRRTAQAHGHPRARHGRRLRAAHPPDRQGPAAPVRADPGPGPRDDVRPDRRPRARHPPGGRRGHPRRHRQHAVRARHLRLPLDAGVRRGGGHRVASGCATRPASWPPRRWSARPTTSSGSTGAGRSRATRTRARRSPRSPCWRTPTSSCPRASRATSTRTAVYNPPNLTYPFGAYICVVDVDPGTGEVKVRRFIAVDDCGPRINPMIVEGQVHGGLADGIGMALMQAIAFDEDGNCLGGSFMDYLLPTSMEVPSFELGETVTPSPHHPLGVKGVGESATVGSPPAVVNAVIDALAAVRRQARRHAADPGPGVAGHPGPSRPDRPRVHVTCDPSPRVAAGSTRQHSDGGKHSDRAGVIASRRGAGRQLRRSGCRSCTRGWCWPSGRRAPQPGDEAIVLADGTMEGFVGGDVRRVHGACPGARRARLAASPSVLRISPTPEPPQPGKVDGPQPVPERRHARDLPRTAASRAARGRRRRRPIARALRRRRRGARLRGRRRRRRPGRCRRRRGRLARPRRSSRR